MRFVAAAVLCALVAAGRAGAQCHGDENGDGRISLGEVQSTFNRFLNGCDGGSRPTATRPPTARPTPTRTPTVASGEGRLRQLLGDWSFTYRIVDQFTDRMRFEMYDRASGILIGFDRDTGADVAVGLTDLTEYEFVGINVTASYCIGYLFDLTGADRVAGITTVALSSDCAAIDGGPFAMTGVRTARSNAAGAGLAVSNAIGEARKRLRALEGQHAGSGAGISPKAIEALKVLQAIAEDGDAR